MLILPAIIGERFEDVQEKFARLRRLVPWVHVDVVDGLFAFPASWPYRHAEAIEELRTLASSANAPKIELHLMVENPESNGDLEHWMHSGASRIIFHIESTPRTSELLDRAHATRLALDRKQHIHLEQTKVETGLALKLETAPETLEHLAHAPQFVQCMSIGHIGSYGAPFNDRVFAKLEYLRRKYPRAALSVDGGVTKEHVLALKAAGAAQLVVGSAIWQSTNIERVIRELEKV